MPRWNRFEPVPKGYLSIKEFAGKAKIPMGTIYTYLNSGKIRFKVHDGKKVIHKRELEKIK